MHRDAFGYLAVDGHGIADTTAVHRVVAVVEVIRQLPRPRHAPVVQHPGQVTIHADRVHLLDDQRPVESTSDLFRTALVRVIPERARIQCIEFVQEIAINRDRVLREERHSVHRIGRADAMPVDCGPFI